MRLCNSHRGAIRNGLLTRILIRMPLLFLLGTMPVLADEHVAEKAALIELTQVACQFLESEGGVDRGYETQSAEDCKRINAQTADQRLQQAEPLRLEPGRYRFRVTNLDVPYELGFWLRGKGVVGRATLPSVSGGGLGAGETRDYVVELEPGEYVYSCPLNPTPDYALRVQAR